MRGWKNLRGGVRKMDNKVYLTGQVKEIAEITYRRIGYFAERCLVIPLDKIAGKGIKRQYSYKNLVEFKICNELYNLGLTFFVIKKIIEDYRKRSAKYQNDIVIKSDYIQVTINVSKIKEIINNKIDGGNHE
jgi:DNA-binding transcriptional MerR regulator